MINLTVKTLDAQNHTFEVEDDITVEQFKVRIADTVNVPAETQRIIYCGRVLQDSSKLSDYNVDGKVVHLVQRPPPGTNTRPNDRPSSPTPQPTRRVFVEPGNTMYLGSMPFPPNLMESQGFVPPPPTHSLAGSRLNVARRMLRRAEAVIRVLENPSARPSDQTPPEETQEEVTPVIEARVIVPSNSNEPIDDAMVLSAVHDTLLNAAGTVNSVDDTNVEPQAESSQNESISSTPDSATPTRSSTENLAGGEQRPESSTTSTTFPENASRTSEMAELLTMLSNLQLRFAPFLERYHNFMMEDPVVAPEDVRQMQAMLTRVSGVLHFLGHAYHSLSDIIIRVRTPPPRPLLCRPILIQHSAVVQAGIPIQVEAQINLSTDRNNQPTETSNNNNAATAESSSTGPPANSSQESAQPSAAQNAGPTIAAQLQPMMSFPFLPGTSMHVQYRSLPRQSGTVPPGSSQNNNNNTVGSTEVPQATRPSAPPASTDNSAPVSAESREDTTGANRGNSTATTTTTTDASAPQPPTTSSSEQTFNIPNFNNPNVEFFMEVTPEVLRGAMNGPPPEILQSLMQVAGQIIGRTTASSPTVTSTPLRTAAETAPQENQPQTELLHSIVQMASQIIGGTTAATGTTTSAPFQSQSAADAQQNASTASPSLQARVNTQTNPTTATHTRSTARPHVHLAQQAMQGGFDPFLPCNSHHLPPRRRFQVHTAQNIQVNGTGRGERVAVPATVLQGGNQNRSNFVNAVVDGIISSLRTDVPPNLPGSQNPSASGAASAGAARGDSASGFGGAQARGTLDNLMRRTIQLMQQLESDGRISTGSPTTASAETANASASANSSTTSPRSTDDDNIITRLQALMASHGIPRDDNVTISEFIRNFAQNSGGSDRKNVFTDLAMLLAQNLTIRDMIVLNSGDFAPFNRLRGQISSFFNRNVLQNSTGPAAMDRAVEFLISELRPFLENFRDIPVRDDIDMVRSAEALFRNRLPNIISIASSLHQNTNANAIRLLFDQCNTTTSQLCALAVYCSSNGARGVEDMFDQMASQWVRGTSNDFKQFIVLTSVAQLRQCISNSSVPASILQPYIVRKSDSRVPLALNGAYPPAQASPPQTEAMEVDEQEASSSGSTATAQPSLTVEEDNEPLPNVVIGSEPWHNQLPTEWVPIITRDVHRQRRQSPQRAFSDAYLSGMPSKRRKIVNSNKPQGTLSQAITDSVRRAVTASGLTAVAPVESVAQAAGSSPEVQTAYRSLLRSSVQDKLKNDKDFTPDRFPNASHYFNTP